MTGHMKFGVNLRRGFFGRFLVRLFRRGLWNNGGSPERDSGALFLTSFGLSLILHPSLLPSKLKVTSGLSGVLCVQSSTSFVTCKSGDNVCWMG